MVTKLRCHCLVMFYRVLPLLVVYVFCNLNSIVYVLVTNVTQLVTLPFYSRGNMSYWKLELWDSAFQRFWYVFYSGLYLSYFVKCNKLCLFVFLIKCNTYWLHCFPLFLEIFKMAADRLLFLTITLIIICNIYQLEIYYHSSVFWPRCYISLHHVI